MTFGTSTCCSGWPPRTINDVFEGKERVLMWKEREEKSRAHHITGKIKNHFFRKVLIVNVCKIPVIVRARRGDMSVFLRRVKFKVHDLLAPCARWLRGLKCLLLRK